jgi:hypothetical protein
MATVDVNGPLGVEGKPASHYTMVKDTCVGCHMGDGRNHRMAPQLSTCVACHADATDYNVNGAVTAFEEKVAQLHDALIAKGLMTENADGTVSNVLKDAAGNPVQLDPPQAAALFTYHLIEEDASKGVHNPNYFNALVDAALEALK